MKQKLNAIIQHMQDILSKYNMTKSSCLMILHADALTKLTLEFTMSSNYIKFYLAITHRFIYIYSTTFYPKSLKQ